MSSDDLSSDEDPSRPSAVGQVVYYVTPKSWRSADFIEFLRLLDRLSDIVEKRTKHLGRSFRVRKPVPSDKPSRESARPAKPNLNREYYTPSHQASLGKYHRYRTVAIDLSGALIEWVDSREHFRVWDTDWKYSIRRVAEDEGVMV